MNSSMELQLEWPYYKRFVNVDPWERLGLVSSDQTHCVLVAVGRCLLACWLLPLSVWAVRVYVVMITVFAFSQKFNVYN